MTAPNADQVVAGNLGGINSSTGGVETYQFQPEAGGRVTYGSDDNKPPYLTNFGEGDVVGSAATYDQVASTIQFVGSRHIDPFGNVVNLKKVWLVQWFWMLDGCPTPLPRARFIQYTEWASTLRPWPETLVDEWSAKGYTLPPAEQVASYAGVDQTAKIDVAVTQSPNTGS